MVTLLDFQDRWRYLYHEYLPALAASKDPAQKHWPVQLDHCFARIILDNAVGVDRPWTDVLQQPAIKNMSATQLGTAIALAEKLATGQADLVELDNRSLELRGKSKKRKAMEATPKADTNKKQKKPSATVSSYFLPSPASPSSDSAKNAVHESQTPDHPAKRTAEDIDMSIHIKRIQDSDITAFRKQTLALLCQVPRGRYSTYGAMSDWISANSHKTCARAVGNAMKNNPFAPEVPCHRILAGDGTLGGFKGGWGEDGKHAKLKHDLLHEEGVRFDSRGKVKGPPFRDFY